MYLFLSGAIAMGSLVAAAFFVRSYARTADRLFLFFAVAFVLLALERVVLGYLNLPESPTPRVYLIRFAAFVLILIGILDKNRSRR